MQTAVDYLDGDQLAHFEAYLDVDGYTHGQGGKSTSIPIYRPLWGTITGYHYDGSGLDDLKAGMSDLTKATNDYQKSLKSGVGNNKAYLAVLFQI